MYLKLFSILMLPGLLLAQTSTKVIPTTPTVPSSQQQQQTQKPSGSSTKPNPAIQPAKEVEKLPVAKGEVLIEGNTYTHPGIYFKKDGRWIGDDNLFNLERNIDIVVEIERTKGISEGIDHKQIKELIANIFKKTTINPKKSADSPYPFFHMLIMIAPIPKGFAVYCSGRLFEPVILDRSHLDKDVYFQAVTWEKQALLVIPFDKFKDNIDSVVTDITNSFVERYRHFEDIKLRQASEQR